ncbi:hypothetical protein L1987_40035 [Smallanthus sonchifolius]|uniref:Uncharacterized protein n=1 Tax=Smallanthus sonchifolius TaxID=185202 RepID=A0ACB9GTJ5_9ASTR|nr:hypothetical protein L1987_40035 [Smallanthus sonchifolius]
MDSYWKVKSKIRVKGLIELKRDRITDGYGITTSDQPLATLEGWKYTAKNNKFVRNAIAKSSHSASVDESLRASYRGSSPRFGTPKSERSASRLGRDGSMSSRSPSVREGSNPPW